MDTVYLELQGKIERLEEQLEKAEELLRLSIDHVRLCNVYAEEYNAALHIVDIENYFKEKE